MALTGKILGQALPTLAATDVTLYTVPALTQTQVAELILNNLANAAAKVTVWLRINGAAKASSQIALGGSAATTDSGTLSAGQRLSLIEPWTLNAGDVVTVQCDTANAVSMVLMGAEIV